MRKWTRWTDRTNVALGAYLMAVPLFTVNTAGNATIRVAELLGAAVALVGLWTLAQPDAIAAQWTDAVLGVALVAAPFAFSYTQLTSASWNAYVVGVAVAVLALCAVPMATRAEVETAAPYDRLHPSGQ